MIGGEEKGKKFYILAFSLILFCFFLPKLLAFTPEFPNILSFEKLNIENGLSQNTGNCVFQDSQGFLWLGTEDGLNRYDGVRIKVYRPSPNDPFSLSDGYILSIGEGSQGDLWIGTLNGGLNRYVRDLDRFEHYRHEPENPMSLSHDSVQVVFCDSRGDLWVGTRKGLNKFDFKTESFRSFYHEPQNPQSLSHDSVISLAEDKEGKLWVGTESGLNKFIAEENRFLRFLSDSKDQTSLANNVIRTIYSDSKERLWIGTDEGLHLFEDGYFKRFFHDPDDPTSLNNDYIRAIIEDNQGNLWVGTYGGGLNILLPGSQSFIHSSHSPVKPDSLVSNFINCIYQDRSGILWIGTFGGGFAKYCEHIKRKFIHYAKDPFESNTLSADIVFAIYQDRDNNLWIGTYGGGLNCFNRKENRWLHYRHEPGNPNSLISDNVRCIMEDERGVLWVGTYDGLDEFEPQTGVFRHHVHEPGNTKSLSHNYIRALGRDDDGFIWAGTFGGGLNRYDPVKNEFISFRHKPEDSRSLSDDRVVALLEDSQGILWIGTSNGLNRFDKKSERFFCFLPETENENSISSARILSIYEDSRKRLWFGTYGGGLNLYHRDEERFSHFDEEDGLSNNVVYGILEDSWGRLWLSTNQGLSCFDPEKKAFRNYDVSDGLQSNEFNSGAYFKGRNGEMFFGGVKGFNSFFPEKIKQNPHVPPVVVTELLIYHKPVRRADLLSSSNRERNSKKSNEIALSYQDRVITFEFAAMDFVAPEKNQYAYFLEGFDKEWNYVENTSQATYTNLNPGRYVFRVKGSNNDGIWNEEGTSLVFRVIPPFWQTWWFRLVAIVAGALLLLTAHLVRTSRVRKRKEELERINLRLEQEILERKKAEQALKEINEELERRVEKRTSELWMMNETLQKEIAGRIKTSEQLENSLQEKEVLLKEIHHRVKNNLQIVSSLLRLSSHRIEDESIMRLLRECENRIKSMSLVHEELYQHHDLARIDLKKYLEKLVLNLFQAFQVDEERLKFSLDVKDVSLNITKAIPCGLILNELLTNSLKHAFPKERKGIIEISIDLKEDGKYLMRVKDDGVGLPPKFNHETCDTLGFKIVRNLTQQLNGSLSLKSDGGTEVAIIFPA